MVHAQRPNKLNQIIIKKSLNIYKSIYLRRPMESIYALLPPPSRDLEAALDIPIALVTRLIC